MWNWESGPLEDYLGETHRQTIYRHMCEKCEKPPLGLMPRGIWLQKRVSDINDAIKRRVEQYKPIPTEWVNELANIISEYEDANHKR